MLKCQYYTPTQATDLWASELGETLQRIDQDLGRQVLLSSPQKAQETEQKSFGAKTLGSLCLSGQKACLHNRITFYDENQ